MKFGISSLMVLVLGASIVCGVAVQGSFFAFAVGFVALAVLFARLVAHVGPRTLTVQETTSEMDAVLLRNYLTEHGVNAWIEGAAAIQPALGMIRPRVVVSEAQGELAVRIAQGFGKRSSNGSTGTDIDGVDAASPESVGSEAESDHAIGPVAESTSQAEEIAWPEDVSSLLRKLVHAPYVLFMDSARSHPTLGRFSFLTADPFEVIRSRRGDVVIHETGTAPKHTTTWSALTLLADRLDRYASDPLPGLPPFQGGAAGLFAYDLCHQFEELPRPATDDFELPDLVIGLYDWVLALDHVQRRAWIIATGQPANGATPRRNRARARIEQVKGWLGRSPDTPNIRPGSRPSLVPAWDPTRTARLASDLSRRQWPVKGLTGSRGVTSNLSKDQYLRAVERAIEYIHAGDIYQVNLAQRLIAPLTEPPIDLYLRLRERNPAPFAAYFDLGDSAVASASPERFLRVNGGQVETRPIKGTRPRWPSPEADMYSAGELRASDKDRAENVMIVDLLRNDLGRVCEFGSIAVSEALQLESYEFVHHLVSAVRGRLRRDCGVLDLLRAAFPGGSVTGAPKIRAMQIIAELEPTARGPYCGSIAYIGFDGSMDSSILIRTFTCSRGWVQFPVGGGIVAESVAEREYEETLHKAEGMIRALTP